MAILVLVSMPFCNRCGSSIDNNSRFCNRCGAQSLSTPQQGTAPSDDVSNRASQGRKPFDPPASDPSNSNIQGIERVLGALPLRQPKSLGRCDSYAAVFTDQRLILAHVTKQVINQAVNDARNEAKAQGKGYWGQISGQMAAWSSGYSDRYLAMTPTAIVAETPGNIAVRNDEVIEVVVKYIVGGEDVPSEYEVEFVTIMGRYKYKMEDRSVHVSMLSKVFTSKLKTPNGLPRGVTITF